MELAQDGWAATAAAGEGHPPRPARPGAATEVEGGGVEERGAAGPTGHNKALVPAGQRLHQAAKPAAQPLQRGEEWHRRAEYRWSVQVASQYLMPYVWQRHSYSTEVEGEGRGSVTAARVQRANGNDYCKA